MNGLAPDEAGRMDSDAPTRRLHTLSAFLLDNPSRLLPLAATLGDGGPEFESSIRGPSMHPTLASGARIRFRLRGDHSCEPGDIVFFMVDGGYMVHRVVYRASRGVGAGYLLTCGDNHLSPDPPVRTERVLGIVVATRIQNTWRALDTSFVCPVHRRAMRAAALWAMVAALSLGSPAARQLAALLSAFELFGRAASRFLRRALHTYGPNR